MSDGTQIWLNSGSKITYDDEYGKSNRTVNLVGEAFFDVKHDPEHPFIIHTKSLNLKVLGTAFNVKAYPEDQLSEASLIRGSLEVSFPDRPTEKILLKPSEKLMFVNSKVTSKSESAVSENLVATPIISLEKVDFVASEGEAKEISWIKNKLVFRDERFENLAKQMERWYNISIVIKDPSLLGKKFTGTFKNETFIEAFEALQTTLHFKYQYNRNTNTIIITN
jgi:ferric-dicitrate binding protein FerR (iron transport regulator)